MEPTGRSPLPSGLVLLVPVALLLTLIAGVYRSFVLDDLYIYLRFTENLLSGPGPPSTRDIPPTDSPLSSGTACWPWPG